jgi:hypothetical protein
VIDAANPSILYAGLRFALDVPGTSRQYPHDVASVNAQYQGHTMNDLIAVEKIAQSQKLKTLVLDSVSSPITKRVYNMALNEFLGWFQQAPRPGFTKATVSAWRVSLEDRGLGSSSIII